LTLPSHDIEEYIKSLENETKDIKKSLFTLCWYMRGSLTVEQAFQLDYESREIIQKLIEDNLETTKTTGLPFF
jgi:hypothetical protein